MVRMEDAGRLVWLFSPAVAVLLFPWSGVSIHGQRTLACVYTPASATAVIACAAATVPLLVLLAFQMLP